jgi:hypothetical protein
MRTYTCNQASKIDGQFIEGIVVDIIAARSTDLRLLGDRHTSNSGWQRLILASGLIMLRAPAVFVRVDVVSAHTSTTAAKTVADGGPERPGAARKCEMLSLL